MKVLTLFFPKKLISMSNQRKWAEYQQLQMACADSTNNIAELQAILKDDSRLQECMVDLGNVTRAYARKHVEETIQENEAHIEECEEMMQTISKTLKRKGLDLDAYALSVAMTEANKHEDSTWKKSADEELERKRPCKITENNITRTVPLGASGYWRDCDNDVEEEIDVLDDSAMPLQDDDTETKLNIFSNSGDINDQEEPDTVVESSAINMKGFRLPSHIAHLLKPHQKEAVQRILKTVGVEASGFLLAHSMGLGKTFTTIAVIEACFLKYRKESRIFRVIVACPKSCIFTTWCDEMERWDEALDDRLSFKYTGVNDDKSLKKDMARWSKRGGVIIMGHDRFRMCQSGDTPLEFEFLVFDEGHILKNPDTLMYQAVNNLQVSRKLLLTGSPLQNHLTEYGAMIRLISPHVFDQAVFKRNFAAVIDRGMMADASDSDMSKARTQIEVLTRMTEDIVHRRSSALLQHSLPAMHEFKLTYKAPLPTSSGIFALTQDTMTSALNKKVALACSLIRQIQDDTDDKILVFSWRKDVLQALSDKIPGLLMEGKCSTSQRQDMIDAFQAEEANVFYMTTKVGSVGLNLYVANRVLILDPAWNPTDDKQACFRAYRYGQTKQVYIYRFVVFNSIEEKIYRLAVHKNLAACRIVDERDVERHFTNDQLKNLDDFEEHALDESALRIKDPVLCKILPKLVSCSSHDILFADAEEEELSDAEKADADNQCNLMNSLQPLRSITTSDGMSQTMASTDIRFDDGKLVPPFAMSFSIIGARERAELFSDYGAQASFIRTFHPIRPLSDEITSHDLEFVSKDWTGRYDKSTECHLKDWLLNFSRRGSFRVRSRARVGNEMSEWSDWSADIVV